MTELLEREELLALLEHARSEGGRLVFLGGEAGVGKTSLVRAFCARTEGRILTGACENLATPSPLGPFADVADRAGGRSRTHSPERTPGTPPAPSSHNSTARRSSSSKTSTGPTRRRWTRCA